MSESIKKIAILTGGGDCPGLNAVIRAATKTAILKYGLKVVGIKNGYRGLYKNQTIDLTVDNVSGIISRGGTILCSSNKDNLFQYPIKENGVTEYRDVSDVGVQTLKDNGCDAIIIIGGDGTLTSGRDYARKGVRVIGVPKTIDNDLAATDTTFGFDTAVSIATDALDRLRTTAASHHRVMVLEVMGRYAGWIALHAGVSGGADAVLIPEIPYDINKVASAIRSRIVTGRDYSLVVVAEGAKSLGGEMIVQKTIGDSPDPIRLGGIGAKVANDLEELTGHEARATILGHLQRGGTPTAYDRILSTRYGTAAVDYLMEGKSSVMVTLKGMEMSCETLENVIGTTKNVDPDGSIVQAAKNIGICFGD